jgi:hypothetical protein
VKLPNGQRADIGNKLEEYTLNADHRRGAHKARVFASVLGITAANQQILATALLEAAATLETVESRGDNGFGMVFTITSTVNNDTRTANVKSVWIIRHGEDFPRLASCYIV